MADWAMLTLIHVLVGYEADVLGMVRFGMGFQAQQALLIIGFLLYTVTAILIVLVKLGALSMDMPVSISCIIMLILAGLFIICGTGVSSEPYGGVLEITAALLAWLAAIFVILQLVGVGGKGAQTAPAS